MSNGNGKPTPPTSGNGGRPAGAIVTRCLTQTSDGRKMVNGPFATPDDAARAALKIANPVSIKENHEYGGFIYQKNGMYYFSEPCKGEEGRVEVGMMLPRGETVVGAYHTHGDYSIKDPETSAKVRTSDPLRDDFDSDNFSDNDKKRLNDRGLIGYLGTPSGIFRRYDPKIGRDTVL